MSEFVKITGLWQRTVERTGETILTGSLGFAEIIIMRNNHKTAENQPDWIMYVKEQKRREPKAPANDSSQGGYSGS